jgi:hypothetical protein
MTSHGNERGVTVTPFLTRLVPPLLAIHRSDDYINVEKRKEG